MTTTRRLILMLIAIALAFWVGRRSMWKQEILARNPPGVELDMLSMVPNTVLGLPIDGWVEAAISATLGALAVRRPRETNSPPSTQESS